MATHSEEFISLEELRVVLSAHAGPDTPQKRPARSGLRRVRPLVLAVASVAALAGAGVAIAAGFGAFEGTPAPQDVSTSFTQLNSMASHAVQQGISVRFPQADVSQARGVIEIQTHDGPEDLWAAPNDQGGQCYFIDWANDPPQQDGNAYGFGGCSPSQAPASNLNWGDVLIEGHPDLVTLWGRVYVPAATVQVTLDDGTTLTAPVIENLFLGSIPHGSSVDRLVAFNAAGNQVAAAEARG